MHSAQGIHRFHVTALCAEEFQPSIQLKTAAVVLKPTETKITALSPTRDVIPEGRQIYQNILTYNLNVSKAQEIALYAPLFNSLLYESEFESQLWMLFDLNKMLIACGDAHSQKFCTKLEKGDYTVRLQIRHEKKDALEKISEANMVALFKLSSPISLDIYEQYNQCIVGGRKFSNGLVKNVPKVVYVAPLSNEKITKAALPSGTAWLNGAVSLAKDEVGRKVHVLKFQYLMSDGASASQSKKTNGNAQLALIAAGGGGNGSEKAPTSKLPANGSGSPKKSAKPKDDYAEGLRDYQCTMIAKIDLDKAEELCNTVLAAHPKHLTAILMYIQNVENVQLKPWLPFAFARFIAGDDTVEGKPDIEALTNTLQTIIEKANTVIKETDKDALLAYYGIKNDTRSDAAKIKTNMEKQRNNLLEGLVKKGIALARLSIIEGNKASSGRLDEINTIYTEIGKFVDHTDTKVANFTLWHAYTCSHHGRMIKLLQKIYDDKRNKDVYEELILLTDAAKWQHIKEALERLSITANPMGYRLF